MGGLFSKTDKNKEEIQNDVDQLNLITNNDLFCKKTGYKMNYIYSPSYIKSILGGKIVQCQIVINTFIIFFLKYLISLLKFGKNFIFQKFFRIIIETIIF